MKHQGTIGEKGVYAGVFLLLVIVFVGIDAVFNYRNLQNFIANEESEAKADFLRHERSLNEISDLIYATVIAKPSVIGLYENAYKNTGSERDRIRTELWELLQDDYRLLHRFRIQQLHFQLPDNESFLRFHKPEQYGDNLSGIRPTIEYVNRTHKPIQGFEEGRIFNGFRYVYPLFDGEKHYLGSVEISSSALSYKEAYELDQKQELDIVMRSDVVNETVFESQRGNYLPYRLHSDFLVEKSIDAYDRKKQSFHEHQECLERLGGRSDVRRKMEKMEQFSIYGADEGRFLLVTFLPLENAITREKVAYAIVFRESEYLKNAFWGFLFESFLAIFAALVVTLAYYFVRQRTKTQRKLAEALTMAREANRAKDAFLSSMSHELRTPLNAIIGFSQILIAKPDTPPSTKGFIEKIHISGKNLLTLVNTILDFSKIESGKMEAVMEPFEMDALIEEVKILIEPMASKNGITLEFNFGKGMIVHADAQLIKQVFVNLLSNAIKFSPEGEKIVVAHEERGELEVFRVCDRGVGIAADQIETLFDPFTQIREHQSESIKGTGLGLSIVKKIVELHGGAIRVESSVGEGSCFYISLPKNPKNKGTSE